MKAKNLDLTQGTIWKKLLLFFLPILAGSMFQQLYTTVDAMIVGQFAGKAGLSAIDSINSLLRLPVNFLVGLSAGATILISQLYGANKKRELSLATHTAIMFALAGGVIFSVLGVAVAPYVLKWMAIPKEIFPMTLSYMKTYLGGLAFSMLYNIGAGILRATGNSKTPVYILIVSGIINVLLDLLFVGGLGWGVSGAATATSSPSLSAHF